MMNASFCVLNRNSAQGLSRQARWRELLARLLQSDIVFILTPSCQIIMICFG
jgi:hypothetical protein